MHALLLLRAVAAVLRGPGLREDASESRALSVLFLTLYRWELGPGGRDS